MTPRQPEPSPDNTANKQQDDRDDFQLTLSQNLPSRDNNTLDHAKEFTVQILDIPKIVVDIPRFHDVTVQFAALQPCRGRWEV